MWTYLRPDLDGDRISDILGYNAGVAIMAERNSIDDLVALEELFDDIGDVVRIGGVLRLAWQRSDGLWGEIRGWRGSVFMVFEGAA